MLHNLPTKERKYHKVRRLLGAFDIERNTGTKGITCNLLSYASMFHVQPNHRHRKESRANNKFLFKLSP